MSRETAKRGWLKPVLGLFVRTFETLLRLHRFHDCGMMQPMTQEKESLTGLRALCLLTWLWLAAAIPLLTNASCGIGIGALIVLSWTVLAIIWLVAAPWTIGSRKRRQWWLAAGAAGWLGAALTISDVGLRIRLAACESSLHAHGLQVVPNSGDYSSEPQWVGLFRVDNAENRDGILLFHTSQSFIDSEGVAYVPLDATLPPKAPRYRFRHLHGQWYRFTWHF